MSKQYNDGQHVVNDFTFDKQKTIAYSFVDCIFDKKTRSAQVVTGEAELVAILLRSIAAQ
jgi:hypothetical protein